MHIRPATRADSADLAILDDVASSGLASWLWSGAVARGEASTAIERGRQKFAAGEGEISWRNASIAEIDGDVAGMSVSYPLATVAEPADAPNAVLKPLYELLAAVKGHRYIDALAVYSRYRGRGIGRGLMRHEFDRSQGSPLPIPGIFPDGAPFPVEEGASIEGFYMGLKQVQKGGKYKLYIPADLAYGDEPPAGAPIPPGADLVFEIEVMDIMSRETFDRNLMILQQQMQSQMGMPGGEAGAPVEAVPAE